MQLRLASIVAFYQPDGKILIQDRRNIPKDDIEWSFFGGGVEGDETFLQCAMREIEEELGIILEEGNLKEIGHTTVELAGIARTEIHVFISPWKAEYDGFQVYEGAGYQWATLDEMKRLFIYPINYPQISLLERYFSL